MATLAAPTLTELITSIRQDLGQTNTSNTKWTDAEITRYIKDAVHRYFGEVVQNSEGLFEATTTLNITANTETISLPATCFEVVGLYKVVDNRRIPLLYRPGDNTSYTTAGGSSPTTYRPTYKLRDNNIVLRDVPEFSETGGLVLDYIGWPEEMTSGSDTLETNVSPIFEELIVAYGVWRAKVAESLRGNGVDTSSIAKNHLDVVYQQFKDVIEDRSHSEQSILPWPGGC